MTQTSLPLVSIGIPTYNRADGYLKQALQSAVDQTYPHLEIIIADNCSTDDTEGVVTSFKDPRINYFKHAQNIGAANNFNFCLDQAQGAYFLMLHDDDLIDPDFVTVCMKKAQYNTELGVIRTGTREIDGQGRLLHQTRNQVDGLSTADFFRGWFNYKTSFYLCSTLFNTRRLKELGGLHSKHNLLQDGVAIVQLAAKYGRADVEEVKASFRKHEGELTFAAKVGDWCDDFLSLLDLMVALAPDSKAQIREEGMRFFAEVCYKRAKAVKSSSQRMLAYLVVYRKFKFRHMPPPVYYFIQRRLEFIGSRA
ncbi:MAG TPA: glycosyltransferase family 2 protein [Anaerolineae bacterium]|nr:glycosyltransferase family 2 protein [Anaerolineae bacterium]